MNAPVFIVAGASHAAAAAIAAMRGAGFTGRIMLIGEEPHAPYERPPLSKEVLFAQEAGQRPIHPVDFYETHQIETRFGIRVERIELDKRHVMLSDGESLRYDKLLLTTGARPRRYPLLDALGNGVHVLRTWEDSRGLRSELRPGRHLLVVGGGIIGLEVASTAIKLGLTVTVLERAPRLMTRGIPLPLVKILQDMHQQHGVTFELDVELTKAERVSDGKFRLRAADGRNFSGDAIVYGVGVQLNDELARAAGLAVEDGILVDALCQTTVPEIYAAGDVARRFYPSAGVTMRQEIWANAIYQGSCAGQAMVTGEAIADEVPWYWTDQYDVNFQVAGGHEAEQWITRGDPASGKYTMFGLTDGRITGAIAANNGRDIKLAKMLIAAKAIPDIQALCTGYTGFMRYLDKYSKVQAGNRGGLRRAGCKSNTVI